jgi:proprotein convertase P-domain-containing protein
VPYEFNDGLATDREWNLLRRTATPLTPEEPLAAFDGENPNGTWTLTISDDEGDDFGELRGWRLDMTTAGCPEPPPAEEPETGEEPAPATGGNGTPPVAVGGQDARDHLRVRARDLSVFAGAAARCHGAQGACRVRVLARGRVIARGSSDAARVPLHLTRAGRRVLARSFGGVRAKVVAGDGSRRARTHTRAILAVERISTPPGSWLADRAALTRAGAAFVRRLHARLFGVASLRCDGYAALPEGPAEPAFADALSLTRAEIVCGRGAKLIGHGSADPIASNGDEAGRAANRRVAVTVRH